MPKFSIIVPVYNVEKYIKKCLDSIVSQTYKDYEVIIINDGSTDKSMDIVKNYDVKIINSDHVEVSQARNLGTKKAKGEYLIFLDSDDYWDKDLLKKLNESSKNNPDLIRFQIRKVTDKNEKTDYTEAPFEDKNGVEAFDLISKYHFVESPCCYAIKRTYYEKEKFSFKKDTIHEDFGLIPLVIIKAQKVNCISYIGYNYFRRTGSIMTTVNYDWIKRKVKDFYTHYKYLNKEIKKTKLDSSIFRSFIANSLIKKICELNNPEYKEYKKKLKEDKVFDEILTNTLPRKIKRILLKIDPKFYYKTLGK